MKWINRFLFLLFTCMLTSCELDTCQSIVCQNGGGCDAGTCLCPSGYMGEFCENENTFKLEINEFSVRLGFNSTEEVQITIIGANDMSAPEVELSLSGEPQGVLSEFSSISDGTATLYLSIDRDASFESQEYTVKVIAKSDGGKQRTAEFELDLVKSDFQLKKVPTELKIIQEEEEFFPIGCDWNDGELESVLLTAEGLPNNTTVEFYPNVLEEGTFYSSTVHVLSNAEPDVYQIEIVATSAQSNIVKRYPIALTVAKKPSCSYDLEDTYYTTSYCNSGEHDWNLKFEADDDVDDKIWISNFYGLTGKVYAFLDCESEEVTIPYQVVNGLSVEGSGDFNLYDYMELDYEMSDGVNFDNCSVFISL